MADNGDRTDQADRQTPMRGGLAWIDAPTPRRMRNLSDSENAVYVAVGGKDGYVGRDGNLAEGETQR